jgi:hypothetical protein
VVAVLAEEACVTAALIELPSPTPPPAPVGRAAPSDDGYEAAIIANIHAQAATDRTSILSSHSRRTSSPHTTSGGAIASCSPSGITLSSITCSWTPPPSTPRRSLHCLLPPLVGSSTNNILNSNNHNSLARRRTTTTTAMAAVAAEAAATAVAVGVALQLLCRQGSVVLLIQPLDRHYSDVAESRGVSAQQPHLRPYAMLADALPYDPLPQVGPSFTPPLAPLPIHSGQQ